HFIMYTHGFHPRLFGFNPSRVFWFFFLIQIPSLRLLVPMPQSVSPLTASSEYLASWLHSSLLFNLCSLFFILDTRILIILYSWFLVFVLPLSLLLNPASLLWRKAFSTSNLIFSQSWSTLLCIPTGFTRGYSDLTLPRFFPSLSPYTFRLPSS